MLKLTICWNFTWDLVIIVRLAIFSVQKMKKDKSNGSLVITRGAKKSQNGKSCTLPSENKTIK